MHPFIPTITTSPRLQPIQIDTGGDEMTITFLHKFSIKMRHPLHSLRPDAGKEILRHPDRDTDFVTTNTGTRLHPERADDAGGMKGAGSVSGRM